MSQPRTTLGPQHRLLLHASVAAAWLSGALWLVDKHFRQVQSDFGPQAPPTQALWLELHGAAAMAVLVLLGSLLPDHARLGWRRRDRRPSGGLALGLCAFLALSGWGLYYLVDPERRKAASLAHWAVGLALPVAIAAHVWTGRKRGRAARA